MSGAGHSRYPPNVRYMDESSSPATESFPPTPVDEATIVEVRPTAGGTRPQPSPKHRRKSSSLGKIYFNFSSKKDKKKERNTKYHGSSATSEATSSSSIRSFSPAPASPHDSPSLPHFHHRSQSATIPSRPLMAYATTARTPTQPDSRGRDEVHWLSPQPHADLHLASLAAHADPPRRPPGPPRPPAPPVPADPPSPEGSGRKRSRRPPPLVTQSLHQSEYSTASAAHSLSGSRPYHTPSDVAQVASDRAFAERLSASLSNLRMDNELSQPSETEDERQARIERERAEGRASLRQEHRADQYWADYHKSREQRREEGRKMNQEQRRSADWETQLEEGRRRVQRERVELQPDERHNPALDDAAPAESSGDDDWEAQLQEGRRRLAELKRTEETANANRQSMRNRRNSYSSTAGAPHRSNTTGGHGRRRAEVRFDNVSSTSSSANATTGTSSSSGGRAGYDEDAERRRLYAFEMGQMERERSDNDAMLAAQIRDAEADIARAQARLDARRERTRRERLVEGQYNRYAYDALNAGAPRAGDFYNPRLGMGGASASAGYGDDAPVRESGRERGHRVINQARGGRQNNHPDSPRRRWDDPYY